MQGRIRFGADGGCSFIATPAEDNDLAVRSLEAPEKKLRARNRPMKIITGHTGRTDDLGFAFLHRRELCRPFTKKYADPDAPYDGYEESDDTEEAARTVRPAKKERKNDQNYAENRRHVVLHVRGAYQ